jgi:hypothetical protein
MTVRIPQGWQVYVTFANHASDCSDGIAVVAKPTSATAVFGGAQTSGPVPAGGVQYFNFTASGQGTYVIASTTRSRAIAGEWVHFDVVAADQPPELALPGQTFAVVPQAGLGG